MSTIPGVNVMATEAQIAANRANAQKSTGPRTAEGKARGSRDGTTHGWCVQATTPEEAARVADLVEAWSADDPDSRERDGALLRAAALAFVRSERIAEAEAAAADEAREEALTDFDRKLDGRFRRAIKQMATDPEKAVDRLREYSLGCRWLSGRWRDAAEEGERPPVAATFDGAPGDAASQAEAWLAEAERLEESEAARRRRIGAIALVDVTRDGQLRYRYLNEAQRSMRASLGAIDRARHQRERARCQAGDPGKALEHLAGITRAVREHLQAQRTDGTDETSQVSPPSPPSHPPTGCRPEANALPQAPVIQMVAPMPWVDPDPVLVAPRPSAGRERRRRRREECRARAGQGQPKAP
jgi:hypothetical protein